jgi:hypothetical protein
MVPAAINVDYGLYTDLQVLSQVRWSVSFLLCHYVFFLTNKKLMQ